MSIVRIEMALKAVREEVNLEHSKEKGRGSLTDLQGTQMLEAEWRSRRWQRRDWGSSRETGHAEGVLVMFQECWEDKRRTKKGPLDMAIWILVVTLIEVVLEEWWGKHQNEWRVNRYTSDGSGNWYNHSRKSWAFSVKVNDACILWPSNYRYISQSSGPHSVAWGSWGQGGGDRVWSQP